MIKLVRIVQWCLLLIGAGWAVYSTNYFIFLARAFPSHTAAKYDVPELLASTQAYVVVFGPVLIAAIFLMVRWPERRARLDSKSDTITPAEKKLNARRKS